MDAGAAPWWAAPATSSVVATSRRADDDEGAASSSGAFGCDVRDASTGARRHPRGRDAGASSRPAIGATSSAPASAMDGPTLRAALAASPRIVVNVTASWCAPCERFKPKFADLSGAFPDVAFVSVDVDALDDDAVDALGVETVPTFLLMRDGEEKTRIVGIAHKRPAKPIAAAIRAHLL